MFAELVHEMAERAQENSVTAGNTYTGEDGLLYCGVCHKPKEQRIDGLKLIFPDGKAPAECDCDKAERLKREEERNRRKAEERVAELQRWGFSDPAYRKQTFEQDKGYSPAARRTAEWYVENYHELHNEGKGIMFMGGTGTGKTFYACCIANALIRKGVPVWVTTMQPLLHKMGDRNYYESAVNQIRTADLLILDDFGTSQNNPRNLELLFEMIDTRKRSGLPLIITTNLDPADFRNAPLELERIYSRIKEMCWCCKESPVIMSGSDLRELRAKEAHTSTE